MESIFKRLLYSKIIIEGAALSSVEERLIIHSASVVNNTLIYIIAPEIERSNDKIVDSRNILGYAVDPVVASSEYSCAL